MASASSRVDAFALFVPVVVPLILGGGGYAAYKVDWKMAITHFLTGPGRTSRILLLFFCWFNWKNLPFAWTFRVFYTIMYHHFIRKSPPLGPRALYKPMISTTRAPLLEIDYNLHKSNSTFFTDLDVSRSHLVSYLLRSTMRKLTHNSRSRLVLDPKTKEPVNGPLGILLGAVTCSFKKECPPFKQYEVWSRILCWDRKWLYVITHFVPKGTARPTEWLDPSFRGVKVRGGQDATGGWERKIIATAISKYVFKVGRLTVNPALMLSDGGMLPERPGGWMSGEAQVGDESVDLSDVDLDKDGEWDWRRVEAERRRGMELGSKFHELDKAHDLFDGGSQGALRTAWPN
ncbi:capsule polysaccharide biosynthesis protein [Emericellopsis atlantica]|uniref:Capsule polysaccharide biosynthesis protein n=1 Tax=Emericellopsis atlantica TaxID=2614577 RepID=A0A9P7ZED2_9HYPO|nr:capsule polysaccharide biosynthesis protein [Emericellopsis atlantica]KAG9249918.1 capsule polysaccharide biosynthesis protein [Emericellopsis atlantica]